MKITHYGAVLRDWDDNETIYRNPLSWSQRKLIEGLWKIYITLNEGVRSGDISNEDCMNTQKKLVKYIEDIKAGKEVSIFEGTVL